MLVWRENIRRWRLLERLIRGQARRTRERGFKKWLTWVITHRTKVSKTGPLQGLSLLASFFSRTTLK